MEIGVDGKTYYYRYNKTYRITSDYSFLNTGLGQSDLKNIDAEKNNIQEVSTSTGNYKIPIGVWASGVTVGKVGSTTAFESGVMTGFATAVNDGNNSIYFVVSDSAGALATAYFVGTDLYTGAGYTIGSDQYIQIYIYVKAAGPKGGFANQSSHGYDKLLGGYRIRLI